MACPDEAAHLIPAVYLCELAQITHDLAGNIKAAEALNKLTHPAEWASVAHAALMLLRVIDQVDHNLIVGLSDVTLRKVAAELADSVG